MPNLASPDLLKYVRGRAWDCYENQVVNVPVASGQTIEVGDLVSINASGEATRIAGSAGAAVDLSATKIFGIAEGRSAYMVADPDLYSKIPVRMLTQDNRVVLRYLTAAGAAATAGAAQIGDDVTLRVAASSWGGVFVGCNTKSGADAVHGQIIDVISPEFVLVAIDRDLIAGG